MPQKHTAAQCLLSILAKNTDAIDLMSIEVKPSYFLNKHDRFLFEVIKNSDCEASTDVLLNELCNKFDSSKATQYLFHILNGPIAENPDYYAKQMIADYLRSELSSAMISAQTKIEYQEKAELLKAKLLELDGLDVDGDSAYFTLGELLLSESDYLDSKIDRAVNYVSSGYDSLDEIVKFFRGHFVVIGGRSGMGKSMFLTNMVRLQIYNHYRIALFSLEMQKEEILEMMLAQKTGIPYRKFMNPDEMTQFDFDRIHLCLSNHLQYSENLCISDKSGVDLSFIETNIKRMKKTMGGLDAVWIDHLHLIKDKGHANIREMFIHISATLKRLAKELDVPIISLAQINREADKRLEHKPQISDFKESSSIESDADSILFAYRESFYSPDVPNPNKCQLIVRKNRHGEQTNVEINFLGNPATKTIDAC